MKTCENCGCRVYSNGCVNCNEELYILDQYHEQGMELPNEDTEFMQKVRKQEKTLANECPDCNGTGLKVDQHCYDIYDCLSCDGCWDKEPTPQY